MQTRDLRLPGLAATGSTDVGCVSAVSTAFGPVEAKHKIKYLVNSVWPKFSNQRKWTTKIVISRTTSISAIAERPRCRLRYSFHQK